MNGVEQVANKECAQITADILGRIRQITDHAGVELELTSGSPKLHGITMRHGWRNAAGEEWVVETAVTVVTSTRQVRWAEKEGEGERKE